MSGLLGSGKTSILYLLREHLGDKTITVFFSTWLPGSQETLTSYLLADIASECKKQYVVPGLRQSTRQLALALGQKVPFLSEYLKLLPEATQKDHINRLRSALLRLPKRVVVLLDELDRMEKEEIMTLLKVTRGIATLPNLSFVCAVDLETWKETTGKNEEYFQKFFPVVISVPEPNPAAHRKMGVDRVLAAFANLDWFESDNETEQFRKRLDGLWDARIAFFCKTLRAVGLLANDVSIAAAPLRREVDPLDLTLIEMLHRFKRPVYKLVAGNSNALTGGETLLRGGGLHDEETDDKARREFLEELKTVSPDDFEEVRDVIDELFPLVSKVDRQRRRARRSEQSKTVETDIRIREPGIFPAYFRYELPDEIFSSVETGEWLKQLERASSEESRESIFLKTLQSMEKGSLKRDDFLRKLEDVPKSISPPAAKSLGLAAVKASDKYTYDSAFPTFAEAGHVLRIIHGVALRLSKRERIEFLRQCILDASDDTMALRILTILPQQKDDSNLEVSIPDLYQSFVTRMRKRYGRDVDAANIDLTISDPWAFNLWGSQNVGGVTADPEDRKTQYDFWHRYIGSSRLRLAQTFRGFFLPVAAYQENPAPVVENKIPVADLRNLYKELPDDPNLTDKDKKSLATLERFLNGEFKNGISPMSDLY